MHGSQRLALQTDQDVQEMEKAIFSVEKLEFVVWWHTRGKKLLQNFLLNGLIYSNLVKTAFQAYSTQNSVTQIFILYTTNDCFGITAG